MKTPEDFVLELRQQHRQGGLMSRSVADRDGEWSKKLAAAERTIEKLGQDAAAIAGRLDRAVDWLRLVARSPKSYNPMALGQFLRDLDKSIASPSQPEPVKAHAFVPCKGDHGPCRFGEFGLCTFNDCGQPDGSPWHATIVPENAGTTCAACKGKGGFDPFGEPMEGQMNPAYQCGACQGRGMK